MGRGGLGASARAGAALSLVLALLAWAHLARDAAEASPRAPSASRPPAAAGVVPAASSQAEVLEAVHLADRLDEARLDAPRFADSLTAFSRSFFRVMPPPHARAAGPAKGLLQMVSIPRQPDDPPRKREPGAEAREDDDRVYDAREALFLPPPASLRLPLRVARGAKLELSPAVVGLREGAIRFEVAVRAGRERTVLDRMEITHFAPPGWHERVVDLSAFEGRKVEIEIATRAGQPSVEGAAALVGTPVIVAPAEPRLPYNVLFLVVDAMRPDPLPAWHPPGRDEARARAPSPPLEAWLPAMAGLAPACEALSSRGVSFVDAQSAATWTRPGTLSMLAGARSGELGVETDHWVLPLASASSFYASRPPLLPLSMRRAGARTQAFANNYWMTGYANAGVDVGFAALVDHRHETLDTSRITRDALSWLDRHRQERFFLFVNFNSPHAPYDPPSRCAARVPGPPDGPRDPKVRAYLGEICKDDEAIGALLDRLSSLGLRETTLVVLTADHGETLSSAHDFAVPHLERRPHPMRFHHTTSIYDETARVPLVLSLPGKLPEGRAVEQPVQTIDIAPTVLAIEGLAAEPRMTGRSLLPWVDQRAALEPERPLVVEGRGAKAIRVGRMRYVRRSASAQFVVGSDSARRVTEELYDLVDDPGERRDLSAERPEVAARMKAELERALSQAPAPRVAGSARLELRLASAGVSRRIDLSVRLGEAAPPQASLRASLVNLDPGLLRASEREASASFASSESAVVGVELTLEPPDAPLLWQIRVDGELLDPARVFAGSSGLSAPSLSAGLIDAEARALASAEALPFIDPRRDAGLFVALEPSSPLLEARSAAGSRETLRELDRLLGDWGYAQPASTR